MSHHPFLYVNSRPWAKRVSNIYQREGARAKDIAREDVARAVRSSPLRMQDLEERTELECELAHAFGRYVQSGRKFCQLDVALLKALDASALPARVPDLSPVKGESFYCVLDEQCGVYIDIAADGQSARLLLVKAIGAKESWWQQADEVLTLGLAVHDELHLPEQSSIERWWLPLNRVLKIVALLTQKHLQWQEVVSEEVQFGRGYELCWASELSASEVLTGGYWRRQGEVAGGRLVWIPPK